VSITADNNSMVITAVHTALLLLVFLFIFYLRWTLLLLWPNISLYPNFAILIFTNFAAGVTAISIVHSKLWLLQLTVQ